jgi:hypothetical protein
VKLTKKVKAKKKRVIMTMIMRTKVVVVVGMMKKMMTTTTMMIMTTKLMRVLDSQLVCIDSEKVGEDYVNAHNKVKHIFACLP